MDEKVREQIAAFRYSLIAPIVSRQVPLAPGELKTYLMKTSENIYDIPGSQRSKISERTLERYLSLYKKGGWEALKPKDRADKGYYRLSPDVLAQAIQLRKERPERSVEQIIYFLEQSGKIEPRTVAESTLARHLRNAGASRKELLQDHNQGYRRFEAEDAHVLWQSDAQHTLYLPDPKDPTKRKKAILFAIIDDYSRYIVHAQFYWDEKLPRLEDTLKKAILRFGIPEQFYCDNGAVYSSSHLKRICGKLGIYLSHSRPYRPAGRGKIERWFRFIDTSFKPEAYQAIQNGSIATLEELNKGLSSWIDGFYHLRQHGSTKQTPKDRLVKSNRQPRRISIVDLEEIFLWEEERKADKASCISLMGNTYEVDLSLAKQKVLLRYDPFDLNEIQVWFDGKRFGNATTIDLKRKFDPRVKPEQQITDQSETDSLSFFDIAEQKRQKELKKDMLSYASTEEDIAE